MYWNVAGLKSKSKYMFISGHFHLACERQHSIFLVLRSKSSSGKCARVHTVTASNNRDHMSWSLYLLLVCTTYICVLLFAHIPFLVNRTFNATPTDRLQQHPFLFAMNRTALLRLESLSNKCAKRHTVAASNNRYHTQCSLYLCLVAPLIRGCCTSPTSRSWSVGHSIQH